MEKVSLLMKLAADNQKFRTFTPSLNQVNGFALKGEPSYTLDTLSIKR